MTGAIADHGTEPEYEEAARILGPRDGDTPSPAGRPLVVGPGVTWTLRLPWEGEQVADPDAPPGIAFHLLDDTGRLTSRFRVVT